MAAVRMDTLTVPTRSALRTIHSSSNLHDRPKKDLSRVLAGKPELERVIGIHDYHDPDPRAFNFDIGDEISVREKIDAGSIWADNEYKGPSIWWLGLNVSTNTLGIFPPSYVQNLERYQELAKTDTELENQSADADSAEALFSKLKGHFYRQYPLNTDPKTTFEVVKWMNSVPAKDFWTPFFLAYPKAAPSGFKLQEQLQSLYPSSIYRYSYGNEVDLRDCQSAYGWNFGQNNFYPDRNLQWSTWEGDKRRITRSVGLVMDNWATFRVYVLELEGEISAFKGMVGRLDGLVKTLQEQLELMETRVASSLHQDANRKLCST
jgi:hypothetical protein